jgi:hypothetical protein
VLQVSLVASRCSSRLGFSYVADEEVYVADEEVSALLSLSDNRDCRFRQRIKAGLCAFSLVLGVVLSLSRTAAHFHSLSYRSFLLGLRLELCSFSLLQVLSAFSLLRHLQ